MTLEVWTGHYTLRDPDWLDVTRLGAERARRKGQATTGEFLAPSGELLWPSRARAKELLEGLLDGSMDQAAYDARRAELWCRYEAGYVDEMRRSYRTRRDEWRALLARRRVLLACFCDGPEGCHRSVAARLLERCGAVYRGEAPFTRALSIRQPWAWAVMHAGKDIENRGPGWSGAAPGEALVHASRGCTRVEYEGAVRAMGEAFGLEVPPLAELPRGGVVGAVEVVDVVRASDSPWWVGPVGLRLVNPAPCSFVECQGALGFFPVSHELLARAGAIEEGGRA